MYSLTSNRLYPAAAACDPIDLVMGTRSPATSVGTPARPTCRAVILVTRPAGGRNRPAWCASSIDERELESQLGSMLLDPCGVLSLALLRTVSYPAALW